MLPPFNNLELYLLSAALATEKHVNAAWVMWERVWLQLLPASHHDLREHETLQQLMDELTSNDKSARFIECFIMVPCLDGIMNS